MDNGIVLLIVGIFYFFAHALTWFFKATRVPDVLILVFVGLLIGPILKLAIPADFGRMGSVVTVVALAIILFESGTKLKLSSLGQNLPATMAITFVTAIVTMGLLAIGSLPFLGGDWSLALLTGAILSGTSSAVVIPMVQSLKVGEKTQTILVLESALTDVICIVLTFAFVDALATGDMSLIGVSVRVLKSLGFAAILGIGGGLIWLLIWDKVRKIPSSVFTTIAFAFILYGLAELMNLSGAISTLCFGITLANFPVLFKKANWPTIAVRESEFYEEIVFMMKTFFFIFLGISIQISGLHIVAVSLLLVVLLYFLRIWITRFTLPPKGVSQKDAMVAAVMIPKGLAPAVLVSLVIQKGVAQSETIQAFVFSVVILSIIITALLIPLTETGFLARLYQRILGNFPSS
ncbi:MAG: cation:proton antiporter [Bdellovibrionales bacterium]|nr:cation:proton antiporter [Bdellovibrionales bacterium]